jgi:CO/xanthine dehydrogenase Mo-binding subunit
MIKSGRGIAGAMYSLTVMNAPNPCSAHVQMREDGSVNIQTGATDIGQGSNTTLSMMAAEFFTIPVEKVSIVSADTSATPYDFGTLSSRVTYTAGRAVLKACEMVRDVLFEAAAFQLKTKSDRLYIEDGFVIDKYVPSHRLPVGVCAAIAQFELRKLPIGIGEHYPFNVPVDANGQGIPCDLYYYHATVADVIVDTETGVVTVKKLYAAVDCGTPINPEAVHGQNEGGALQAYAWALSEDAYPYMTSSDGIPEHFNSSMKPLDLSNYPIPTTIDAPELESAFIDNFEPEGPFGAKAAGEICANSGAPAIINAIHDAVGIWVVDLPATPDKVLKLIKEKEAQEA